MQFPLRFRQYSGSVQCRYNDLFTMQCSYYSTMFCVTHCVVHIHIFLQYSDLQCFVQHGILLEDFSVLVSDNTVFQYFTTVCQQSVSVPVFGNIVSVLHNIVFIVFSVSVFDNTGCLLQYLTIVFHVYRCVVKSTLFCVCSSFEAVPVLYNQLCDSSTLTSKQQICYTCIYFHSSFKTLCSTVRYNERLIKASHIRCFSVMFSTSSRGSYLLAGGNQFQQGRRWSRHQHSRWKGFHTIQGER